jgi:23S rRNA (uracil1939-C5)-methyltransferase
VAVSCDAGTFARDADVLVQGGFKLERVVPVDQFKYAAHVEMVGVFKR